MLCHSCRVHLRRDFPYCLHCGTPRRRVALDDFVAPVLMPLDGALPEPVALTSAITTLGRAPDNDVVIADDSVSRHHARILRRAATFVVEDLRSLNGVRVGGRVLHGLDAELTDGAVLELGDALFRFDQPRSAAIGGRTVHGAAHTVLGVAPELASAAKPPTATEPLSARPRKRSGWALKQLAGSEEQWVLSTRSGTYLQLDGREAFIFGCIDGQSTVRDILFRYADQFGELALPRIERALQLFQHHQLIDGLPGSVAPALGRWRRIGRAVYQGLLKLEISVGGLDAILGRLYRSIGWRAFTRTGVLATWLTIGVGLWAFLRAQGGQRLFDVGGAGWWGALLVGAGYLLALIVHETAHALAVKSYGRSVRRGGFLLMMGMPFAFVDTSDMWFGTRWSRVVVALSGPISTAALAGLAAMGALWLPGSVAPALCFQLAFGLYLNTAYNFNPIMPLDGYQALTDAFRIPRLREQASRYFRCGLWADLAARRRPRPHQVGLALYGLAVVVGGYLFLLLGLIAWRHRLGPLVHRYLDAPWDTLALIAGVVLVTFPVWVRTASSVRSHVTRRRTRANAPSADPTLAVAA